MREKTARLFMESEIRALGRAYAERHGIQLPPPKQETDVGSWIKDPNRKRIIAIDFDGTIVQRGSENNSSTFQFMPSAKESLLWIFERFTPILWTCRQGKMLHEALDFLQSNGIYFKHVNENVPELPFSTSSKIYADFYIDDKALVGQLDWFTMRHHLSQTFMSDDPETLIIDVVKGVIDDNV